VLSNWLTSWSVPSVKGRRPEGALAAVQPTADGTAWQRTPMATRSSLSTTSSPGRRPLGKPALSPPSTPRLFCDPAGVGAMAVLRRSISEGTPNLLTPVMPVRKAAIRSVRGKLVGALTPALPNRISSNAGRVGLVT